jgi:oligopeptide transport system substrate-binding protein
LERGTLYRGNAAEPDTLDPALAQGNAEDLIMGDLLTGLLVNGKRAEPVPGMATSWTTSPDGLVWTFKLREALWSDGVPVTAEDFIFSWRRILDPKMASPYAYFLYPLKNAKPVNSGKMPGTELGVRALDPHTLELTLEHPVPYLLEMLTHMTMYPEPRHVVTAKGKEWSRPGNYVGNGAFTLTEWVPNDHITLMKNPRFFDAANVALEKVIYFPTTDYGTALRQFRAGELDIQERYPVAQVAWIKANMANMINPVPQLITEFITVNTKRKPLDDIRVRTALNLTINREMYVQKITRGGEIPAYGLVPPNVANYPDGQVFDFKPMPAPERVKRAEQLMREAGFGPDKKVRLTYALRSTAPGASRAWAAALQQALAVIYIDMTILPFDSAVFYANLNIHDYDLAQAGWVGDFNDASTFLELFVTGGGGNWGEYSNPTFDALLEEGHHLTDLAARGQKLAEAETVLLKDHAFLPLFFWVSAELKRPYVKDWEGNNRDIHRSRWISIDEAARAAVVPI